jgi:hypothetical protein
MVITVGFAGRGRRVFTPSRRSARRLPERSRIRKWVIRTVCGARNIRVTRARTGSCSPAVRRVPA